MVPLEAQRSISLHFEADVPICDLTLTKPQKARLTRVKAIYMAWLQNPYINPLELSRSMLKSGVGDNYKRTDAGDLLNAAKKDVVWFEWVQDHFLKIPSRKTLQYRGIRTAERMITAGFDAGDMYVVDLGMKQQFKYGGLDRDEDDPNRINDVAFTELIPTTDVTKVDPTRKRITAERRLELASKWGAHIDEHGMLIDKDGKAVGGSQESVAQEITEGEEGE